MHPQTPEELFALVDDAVAKWADIVVPIFVDSEKSDKAANGLGSAYLCSHGEHFFLVTALHVITDANKSNLQVANINGKGVDIGGLRFHVLETHDLAVAELEPEWFHEKGVTKIKAARLRNDLSGWQRTGIFVAIGYPETKNRLDMRYEKLDRYCLSITVSIQKHSTVSTSIQDAIHLSYDPKTVINSYGEKLGPQPDLYGMSGGPCLELLRSTDTKPTYSLDPIGVLTEWHKKDRTIIAAPLSACFSFNSAHDG